MVNLTRIYTRTGDDGSTRLSDGSTARKTDPRVEAYGAVDEANSVVGIALADGGLPDELAGILREIQNELFDLGADLSNPVVENPQWEPLRIEQPCIDRLERWCDELGEQVGPLASFILPGGSPAAARLHLARTVVRRAERAAWASAEVYGLAGRPEAAPGGVNPLAITYLNRLSDLLFIASRVANLGLPEVLWVPGKDRETLDARASRQRRRIAESQESRATQA